MKRFIYYLLPLLLLSGACSRGGSARAIDDDDGEAPVEITVARATTGAGDSEVQTVFREGTEIAVVTDDGTRHRYKYNTAGGTFTAATANDKIFFGPGVTNVNVEAFYPWVDGGYEKHSIYPSQESADNYYNSDVLHAAGNIARKSNESPLAFYHAMSKLLFDVTVDDGSMNIRGVKIPDVPTSAKFSFNGDGSVNDVSDVGNTGNITSNSPDAGKYRAVIIPRQNTRLQVIVSMTNGEEYAATLAANDFEPGKQYNYTLAVKNKKLEVTIAGNGAEWTDDALAPAPSVIKVYIPADAVPTGTVMDGLQKVAGSANEYTVTKTPFTIKTQGLLHFFNPIKGISDVTQTVSDGKRIFTCYARSDLWLECKQKELEAGDYYYSNGEWAAEYFRGDNPACIGVVFRVGTGTGDNVTYYGGKLSAIRGYVVALNDVSGSQLAFGTGADISGFDDDTITFHGYRRTQELKSQSGYSESTHGACYTAVNYTPQAPAASSGWYLASPGEWNALWKVLASIRDKIDFAGGMPMIKGWGFYWSLGNREGKPIFVDFGAWGPENRIVTRTDYQAAFCRSILTF